MYESMKSAEEVAQELADIYAKASRQLSYEIDGIYEKFRDKHGLTDKEAMALLSKAKTVECIISYENFFDCKRRNTEPEYAADVVHHMDDFGDFTIRPNSPLWIYPFPMNATNFNPSLTQNI